MRIRLLAQLMIPFAMASTALAAPPIEIELATERGLQITAPHEWLQLFANLGIDNVRIRGANRGDRPLAENVGSDMSPRYHVVGIISPSNLLELPGGKFSANDREKLRDYFDRLAADGAESLTAPTGRFGLTEKEFTAAHADLAQPIQFPTKGLSPNDIIRRLQSKFAPRMTPDAAAAAVLRDAVPVQDEVGNLTAGTGLAMMLRSYGLALRPEKSRGQPVVLRVTSFDAAADSWPVGWKPEQTAAQLLPVLMEFLNVEIEGYTLTETIDAIAPRIKVPFYWDHAVLASEKIDPNSVQISVPQTHTFYKRVLDRALAQARLAGQLRVDEAGTPFYWITQ